MVKDIGVPGHPLAVGVTVIVAEMEAFVPFVVVKEGIFPFPLAPSPIAVLLLVQAKVVPATGPEKVISGTEILLQKV